MFSNDPGRCVPVGVRVARTREGSHRMDEDVDQLNRYVEDLVAGRRPPVALLPNRKALRTRQAAARLSAARPGTGIPSRQYLTRLAGEIARGMLGPDSTV